MKNTAPFFIFPCGRSDFSGGGMTPEELTAARNLTVKTALAAFCIPPGGFRNRSVSDRILSRANSGKLVPIDPGENSLQKERKSKK